jgi:CubicO group peptidase (beta-lactamase class C family)
MPALDAIDDWPVPSAAAAVIGPAGVLATHGDTAREFVLASVTKPLVARAAQIAVEEGVVDLDTAAGPPGCTIRHLLSHAAGLAMNSDRAQAPPGTRRTYSNYGFTVLAEAVQRESGIEFSRYLTEAVFEPLGMAATRLDGGVPAAGFGGISTVARNSARTYGHFGQAGGFIWADPEADLALAVLTDRDFGEWTNGVWQPFSDAVLTEYR